MKLIRRMCKKVTMKYARKMKNLLRGKPKVRKIPWSSKIMRQTSKMEDREWDFMKTISDSKLT
jgi:hypothetical protein